MVNARLFCDSRCSECRNATADELSGVLQDGGIDEQTRLTAIKEYLYRNITVRGR